MTLKRAISYAVVLLFLFILAAAIVLASFSFLFPHLLETRLLTDLERQTGISELSMQVRELDLEGADFSDVRVGPESEPTLVVRSIQIDYSTAGLYQKKIKKVIANGLELYCEFKDGKLGFRGLDLESLIQRLQSRLGGGSDPSETHTLLALERLIIRNAVIIFEINSKIYRIPCEIDILPENAAFDPVVCRARIYARGQKFEVTAKIDLNKKSISLTYAAKNVILARFADFTGLIEGLSVSGVADLSGTTNLMWEPFTISSHVSTIELRDTRIDVYNVQFQNPPGPKKKHLPLRIQLEGVQGADWELRMSAIAGLAPIPFTLSEINSRFNFSAETLECSGKFTLTPVSTDTWQENALPVEITEHVPLRVNYTMRYSDTNNWSLSLANQISKAASSKINIFKFNHVEAAAKTPVVKISGNVRNGKGKATYRVKIPQVNITSDVAKMTLPAVFLTGTANINRNQNGIPATTFNLKLPGSRITINSAEIKIPQLTLSGKSVHNNGKNLNVEALLRWEESSIIIPEKNATISGIQGTIPLQWPLHRDVHPGRFSAGRLTYQNVNMGVVSGTLQQTAQGILFTGTHRSRLVPQLALTFRGNTKLFDAKGPETTVNLQLAPALAETDIDLGKFLPQATGVLVGGNFSLNADLVIGKQGLRGSLNTGLTKGYVRMPEKKVSIEGIQMALSMPDLPNIRSAPRQQLFFEKAAAGGIEVSDSRIEFQIESLTSLFIEKSQFIWCDGNVDVYALRISAGTEDYRLILYCDRLNMAKVLEQFGAATAVGEGTVNGRIPLRYQNGMLSFDDGFLFSTPGETGKIRLTDTELLTAGIAPNTPQYVQMELAREALKDYDVSWAKLNITSEGEDVLLRMQLDGKPANLLPFVYKKELGGFAKIEAKGKGSKFQGIRLDVNFRLPLNKLLQYSDLIQMIQ